MAYELMYTSINNGTEYEVFGYAGEPVDVVIPSEYNGKPITSIGEGAFYTCSSLMNVVIPDNVTSIGIAAFYDCSSLTSITLLSKTPASVDVSSFDIISANAKFYCYSNAINTYKTATNWNIYADRFVADDMRLYFIMNASAQKRYFVSKAELQETYETKENANEKYNTFVDLSTTQTIGGQKTFSIPIGVSYDAKGVTYYSGDRIYLHDEQYVLKLPEKTGTLALDEDTQALIEALSEIMPKVVRVF